MWKMPDMNDAPTLATGPADLRDQRWLDEKVAAVQDGVAALFEIAANWTEGRNLARLHPGVSAAAYVQKEIGRALGREVILPLLEGTDWSNRQIAAVAGVHESTVRYHAGATPSAQLRDVPAVERPAETLGADGKYRSAPMPRIAFVEPEPEPAIESADYGPLMDALRAVENYAGSDFREMFDALTPHQQRRARASARRALKVLEAMFARFDADVAEVFVVEGG